MTHLPEVSLNKIIFWIKITIFQQMKYFNENWHINNLHILRNWSFLSEFDTLLMYINLHTRSHIYLKISIFCKKMIAFSSSAHLMEKSTFLPKFQFFRTKLTFLHQNWYWQKHLSLCLKDCTTLFYHCT